MNSAFFAATIKNNVTTKQAAERYGLTINRAGFCCCPFHGEKTPSMKIYPGSKGFFCFGCGASGDVITLVERMFGLSFSDALKKINEDFALNLSIGEKIPVEKRIEAQDKANHARLTKAQQLEENKRKYAPKNPEDPLDPRFVAACRELEYEKYREEFKNE